MSRSILAVAAALLVVAAAATLQVASYATPPPTTTTRSEPAWAATLTSCQQLRVVYGQHHNVWRAGVKAGHEPAESLAVMRVVLRRLGVLERAGRCGG